MDFFFDLPWPWSLSPIEALQDLASHGPSALYRLLYGAMGRLVLRGLVGALMGLVARLVLRGGGPGAIALIALLAGVGVLLAGQPLPLLAIVLVVFLTVATYRGASGQRRSTSRLLVVLLLRLFALLLTFLTLTRPTLLVRSEDKVPSVLVIMLDLSASMTVNDEFNNQRRFDAMRSTLEKCDAIFKQLQEESQISVVMLGFAGDVTKWDKDAQPDGLTSHYSWALASAYEQYKNEPNLRGLLVIGDGAHNGHGFDAQDEARKLRSLQCPVNCFVLGFQGSNQSRDISVNSVVVEPSPVFVKGRMILRASINAPGFENAPVEPRIFIDDKEVAVEKKVINGVEPADGEVKLSQTENNELYLETTAPEKPGEVRVTLRIKALPGEVTATNNEIGTFVTIAKEGVSVLLIAPLDEETKYIRQVLRSDPRIRLFETTRQTDDPPRGTERELFNFEHQAYDVIVLRNVSRRRLEAGDPQVLNKIHEMVTKKGAGLLMMGGFDSFGGSQETNSVGNWNDSPIASLLPVEVDKVSGHIVRDRATGIRLGLYPTKRDGESHYLLKLAPQLEDSRKAWDRLNEAIDLPGFNRLGAPKPGTTAVLARAGPNENDPPVMVSHSPGKGRVLAFAGDTTYLWRIFGLPENFDGADIHARFWKQTILWLAQQENVAGSVWIKPDSRRLAAGQRQEFSVGIRGKSGFDLPINWAQQDKEGKRISTVHVVGPDGVRHPVTIEKEGDSYRGKFPAPPRPGELPRPLKPGEYRIEAAVTTPDVDKKDTSGTASVRFLVYQDERELLRTAADPSFLGGIAQAGGGRPSPYRIDDLPDFLTRLKSAALPDEKVRTDRYPDWRSRNLTPFLPLWLILLVLVLCLEWGLRRLWGMV